MSTYIVKKADIKREWRLVDFKDQILGRKATEVAQFLIGKGKVCYTPNLDCGDYVVVINASRVQVTGKKQKEKKYYHHTGYRQGLREYTYEQLFAKNPAKVVWQAVKNMLPKNKLRKNRLARLKIYTDEKHPYENFINNKNTDSSKKESAVKTKQTA